MRLFDTRSVLSVEMRQMLSGSSDKTLPLSNSVNRREHASKPGGVLRSLLSVAARYVSEARHENQSGSSARALPLISRCVRFVSALTCSVR